MARRKSHSHRSHHSHNDLPTLNQKVPHLVAYAILLVLLVVSVMVVRKVTGVNY